MTHWTKHEIIGRCDICGGKVAKGDDCLYCQGCGSRIDRNPGTEEIAALVIATKRRRIEMGIKTKQDALP